MKKQLYSSTLPATSLIGCGHKKKLTTSDTLLGSWRFTAYQCSCPPGQAVTLDINQQFRLLRNGQLAAEGTYTTGKDSSCTDSSSGSEDIIMPSATTPTTYVPKGACTVQSQTLIIDQCSAADGLRYTYTRQ